jgi:hypothetical protein
MPNAMSITLVLIGAVVVVALLIWKNRKDKKLLNPDADDAVTEAMMDQERKKERL